MVLNEETADRLGLIPGEEVIRFKNIRVASERHPEAVVVTYVYIYPNALEVLDLIKKRSDDLIITLAEEVTGQECVEVKQAFSATTMPKESVRHFPCAGEQPVAQNHSKLLRLKRPLNRRLGIFPHG